jgi:hypothetical protein
LPQEANDSSNVTLRLQVESFDVRVSVWERSRDRQERHEVLISIARN